MFKILQNSLCVFAAISIVFASLVRAEEEEQPPQSEPPLEAEKPLTRDKPLVIEIVGGHYDYCQIETIRKRLNRDYEENLGGLIKTNTFSINVRCEGKACLSYYHAGRKSVRIKNVDVSRKNFTIWAGSALCAKAGECAELLKSDPAIVYSENSESEANSKYRKFAFERKISFDEMYDADFKDVNVSCPVNKCKAFIYESESGPLFYLESKSSEGKLERKLIVNLDIESKLTDSDQETILKKCESR